MSLAGKRLPPDQLATQLANQAKARDIRITQYALADNSIHIWAEKNVEGTWVLGPYLALAKGTPLAKAWKATFVVKDDGSESFR
jgi:hypothetical protein